MTAATAAQVVTRAGSHLGAECALAAAAPRAGDSPRRVGRAVVRRGAQVRQLAWPGAADLLAKRQRFRLAPLRGQEVHFGLDCISVAVI